MDSNGTSAAEMETNDGAAGSMDDGRQVANGAYQQQQQQQHHHQHINVNGGETTAGTTDAANSTATNDAAANFAPPPAAKMAFVPQNIASGETLAHFVRKFETYISDGGSNGGGSHQDHFKPLNMFQQLSMCGMPGDGLPRLRAPQLIYNGAVRDEDGMLHEPISVRHTHSTPLRYIPSLMGYDDDEEDDDDNDNDAEEDGKGDGKPRNGSSGGAGNDGRSDIGPNGSSSNNNNNSKQAAAKANPPSVGLNLFKHRSRSTPLSTSANSAFGTIWRSNPSMSSRAERSAFLPPSHRPIYYSTRTSSEISARPQFSSFNPIVDDSMNAEAERSSIEVVDLTPAEESKTKVAPAAHQVPKPSAAGSSSASGSNSKSRTSRFLSEMKRFGRRSVGAGGGSSSSTKSKASPKGETKKSTKSTSHAVNANDTMEKPTADGIKLASLESTTTTADDNRQLIDENLMAQSCDMDKNVSKVFVTKMQGIVSERIHVPTETRPQKPATAVFPPPASTTSSNIDSPSMEVEMDENYDHFPVPTGESPCSIPSPLHQPMFDDRPPSRSSQRHGNTNMFFNSRSKTPVHSIESPVNVGSSAMDIDSSEGSPGTFSRTSGTTYTSGHTTHATGTTGSTGRLSAMSQTDREVMETNKIARFLSRHRAPSVQPRDSDLTSVQSTSTASTNLGYVPLEGSPVPLREGANLPADRFFTFADPQSATLPRNTDRSRTASSKSSRSSSTMHSISTASHSNNTGSSVGDVPPTFVSYLDKKMDSDLTSLREETEASSQRARASQSEAREESPSEFLGNPNMMFNAAEDPSLEDLQNRPHSGLKQHFRAGGRTSNRVRSLPPRSPSKGRRTPTATPPPRSASGSVSPGFTALSPPRNIVDYRPNVSRPHVLRTAPSQTGGHSLSNRVPLAMNTTRGIHPFAPSGPHHGHREHSRVQYGYWPSTSNGHHHHHRYFPAQARGGVGGGGGMHGGPTSLASLRSRTYMEHSIEILKTDSKDETSQQQFNHPIMSPENPFDEA